MSEFILMLTRNDVTVADAESLLDEVLDTDIRHVGFKDIGLPADAMQRLVDRLHGAGRLVHLEVVSLSEEDELRSAQVGRDLGVDYLIGGTRWREVSALLAGTDIKYFPYPGEIVGHPATLRGDVDQFVTDAEAMGESADGINLLAYRHETIDGLEVLRGVLAGVSLPVIVAGSIDSVERVRAVAAAGAWAFTIGGAALDGMIVPGAPLKAQIEATLAASDAGSTTAERS
jgi:hypothetical protein